MIYFVFIDQLQKSCFSGWSVEDASEMCRDPQMLGTIFVVEFTETRRVARRLIGTARRSVARDRDTATWAVKSASRRLGRIMRRARITQPNRMISHRSLVDRLPLSLVAACVDPWRVYYTRDTYATHTHTTKKCGTDFSKRVIVVSSVSTTI